MSIELKMLVWSVVLGLCDDIDRGDIPRPWRAAENGPLASRDEIKPPLAGIGGRLERAQREFSARLFRCLPSRCWC